jgi:hypothetical protein
MQISVYVHSMSMWCDSNQIMFTGRDFVSGDILFLEGGLFCGVMLTKICSLCVQLALGDSNRKRASDVLWPNEESHRCSSNTGSLKP